MKIFYALLLLCELLPALLLRDTNRVAYLIYLWSNQIAQGDLAVIGNTHARADGNYSSYKETQPETTDREYSLLTER